jgi:hypothetical protein
MKTFLKEVLKILKEIFLAGWETTDGKKTIIGNIWLMTFSGMDAFFPKLLTEAQYAFLISFGMFITGVGWTHKYIKNKQMIRQLDNNK